MENIFHSLNASKTQKHMERLLAKTPGTPPVERTQIPLQLFETLDQAFHIQTVVSPIRPKWLSKSVEHLSICSASILSGIGRANQYFSCHPAATIGITC